MAERANYVGFNPPFYGGPGVILPRQADERLIKNDLLQLLLTLPGERMYRPTFGTSLRAVVFDQIDDSLVESLRQEIIDAIADNDDRVRPVAVTITPDPDKLSLHISVDVVLTSEPNVKYLIELSLGLNPRNAT